MSSIEEIKFHNALNECKRKQSSLLTVYSEILNAFNTGDWGSKAPRMAIGDAVKAGSLDKNQEHSLIEQWADVSGEGRTVRFPESFNRLQDRLEEMIFNSGANCAFKSLGELDVKLETPR